MTGSHAVSAETYMPRLADEELKNRLMRAGAVVIKGPKWCGKTTTAKRQAASVLYMQDPDKREHNMLLAQVKPSLLLEGEQPRLIDEWQDAPQLWDAVRFAVDREQSAGHYILTGSATPGKAPAHSGAGRISPLFMRTMSLFESGDSSGSVSLTDLFDSPFAAEGTTFFDIETAAHLICRGGWPQAVRAANDRAAYGMSGDYLHVIAEEDISRVDDVQRNPTYAMLIMRSYAQFVSTQASFATIRSRIKYRQSELSRGTVDAYVTALRRLYVFDDLEAWRPSLRDKTRITTTPTRHFVDPALAAAALGAGPDVLLKDLPTLGLLFESLCIRDLRIYAQSLGGAIYRYHDDAGREADAVIVMEDGRWALVEVKIGSKHIDDAATNLLALVDKIDTSIMGTPSFCMVMAPVDYAYVRPDGVCIVPPSCLRP